MLRLRAGAHIAVVGGGPAGSGFALFALQMHSSGSTRRYVVVGDAAGLVRAFKGKGINSACESAAWAAECILTHGISAQAFRQGYLPRSRAIMQDIPYGRLARQVVIWMSFLRQVDRGIELAERWPPLRRALFAAVSGSMPYRAITLDLVRALLPLFRSRQSRR